MTAARPDPAAAALDPAGRCAGTPGPAAATTGPPEYGRLDRILAEVAQRPPELNQAVTEVMSSLPSFAIQPGSAVERLRAMVVALESENAALTDALDEFTHGFVTDAALPPNQCGWSEHGDGWDCTLSPRHPVHRTAAVVTAESEHGSRHALYRCPSCERVALWTDGRLAAAGDPEDEFWCQTCGAETPLSACAVVAPARVRAELEER